MSEKVRFFVHDVDGDEGAMHCGDADNIPEAKKGLANLLETYLSELGHAPEEKYTIELTARLMTDEEVESLPEL